MPNRPLRWGEEGEGGRGRRRREEGGGEGKREEEEERRGRKGERVYAITEHTQKCR